MFWWRNNKNINNFRNKNTPYLDLWSCCIFVLTYKLSRSMEHSFFLIPSLSRLCLVTAEYYSCIRFENRVRLVNQADIIGSCFFNRIFGVAHVLDSNSKPMLTKNLLLLVGKSIGNTFLKAYCSLFLLSIIGRLFCDCGFFWALCYLFGLCRTKMCLWAYADSEGPDQPAHSCSLIRAFTVC